MVLPLSKISLKDLLLAVPYHRHTEKIVVPAVCLYDLEASVQSQTNKAKSNELECPQDTH